MEVKRIVLTVTTDLNFDQRMRRIAGSLAEAGYDVLLIGRQKLKSLPLTEMPYAQKRLYCFFQQGPLFYAEFNIRLFVFLLFTKMHAICAIDLDTILACLFVSKLKGEKRVYDAHELFCEMDEIVSRPNIYKIWKAIEKFAVPKFKVGYTIGECYAEEFKRMYALNYGVVRNATKLMPHSNQNLAQHYILYQGAVNEGRSFETLIPAMENVNARLIVCGEGNFYQQAKQLVAQHGLEDKVIFKGYIEPEQLKNYTKEAYVGITLFTDRGKSNYLSMANRFFDYMHAGVPQLCMNYPEYKKVNEQYEIALLIQEPSVEQIANALNKLLEDKTLYNRLRENCFKAREIYSWQAQEKTLLQIYKQLLD